MQKHLECHRMTQSRKNLVNAINERKNSDLQEVEKINSFPDYTKTGYCNIAKRFLTLNQYNKAMAGFYTLDAYKNLIISRIEKKYAKELANAQNALNAVYSVEPLQYANIYTNWKNTINGPKPDGTYTNDYDYYTTKRPSGGNYDSYSTVTARLLNQDKKVIRALVDYVDNNNLPELNRNNFEYGIGYHNGLPYFCEGVGFSCHQRALQKLGYTVTEKTQYGRLHRMKDHIRIEKNN